MTRQEAVARTYEILNALGRLGVLPPPGIHFALSGGSLQAEPHPELQTEWRPVWRPHDESFMPLDLEAFAPGVAARQIARYANRRYPPLRRKLEDLLAFVAGNNLRPIEEHSSPDSFLVGVVGLHIRESLDPDGPNYALIVETDPIPGEVGPGERTPEPTEIDVTDYEMSEIFNLCLGGSPQAH